MDEGGAEGGGERGAFGGLAAAGSAGGVEDCVEGGVGHWLGHIHDRVEGEEGGVEFLGLGFGAVEVEGCEDEGFE